MFDALVHRGVRDVFAMCLGEKGGVLMIGGVNEDYLQRDAAVNYAMMDVATYRIPITQLMVEHGTCRTRRLTTCQSATITSIRVVQY